MIYFYCMTNDFMDRKKEALQYCYFCMKRKNRRGLCDCAESSDYTVHISVLTHPVIRHGRYVQGMPVQENDRYVTYISRDLDADRRVHMKEYRTPDTDADPDACDRFEENGHLYVILPVFAGMTLAEYVADRGPLPYAETARIFEPVRTFLEQGAVCGTLSDTSVVYGEDNCFHVQESQQAFPQPGYTAPEVWNGETPDARSDLYSLAALMWHALTGLPPADSYERGFRDELETPSFYGSDIPTAAQDTLMQALSLNRKDRPASVSVLFPKRSSRGGRRPPIRNRYVYAALALAAVLLVTVLVLFSLQSSDNPYREDDSGYSLIENTDVTDAMIRRVTGDEKTISLELNNCTISNSILERIADCGHIETLRLDGCTGFTSLDMLAGSPVTSLSLAQAEDIDGSSLLTADLNGITSVEITASPYCTFYDADEFLRHFPDAFDARITGIRTLGSLEFVTAMPQLVILDLSETEKTDAWAGVSTAPLAQCPSLQIFNADRTGITDLSGLRSLSALSSVSVEDNGIADMSALGGHPTLASLHLADNRITDLAPLASDTSLLELYLQNNPIADITPLSSLGELTSLDLTDTQITTLDPLRDLVSLRVLSAGNTGITDLSPLHEHTELSVLSVPHTGVSSLTSLSAMAKLVSLDIAECQVTSLDGIQNCTNLFLLDASGNGLDSLAPLAGRDWPEMRTIRLSRNAVTDISPLAAMPKLEYVGIEHNLVTDLSPLGNAEKLTVLFAQHNEIEDIHTLPTENLQFLDLADNRIRDISVLGALKQKTVTLLLANNRIEDISILPALAYRDLWLYGNPIRDLTSLTNMKEAENGNALMVSWQSGMEFLPALNSVFYPRITIVDMDESEKASLLHDIAEEKGKEAKEPEFLSKSEADAASEEWRAEHEKYYWADIEVPVMTEGYYEN